MLYPFSIVVGGIIVYRERPCAESAEAGREPTIWFGKRNWRDNRWLCSPPGKRAKQRIEIGFLPWTDSEPLCEGEPRMGALVSVHCNSALIVRASSDFTASFGGVSNAP